MNTLPGSPGTDRNPIFQISASEKARIRATARTSPSAGSARCQCLTKRSDWRAFFSASTRAIIPGATRLRQMAAGEWAEHKSDPGACKSEIACRMSRAAGKAIFWRIDGSSLLRFAQPEEGTRHKKTRSATGTYFDNHYRAMRLPFAPVLPVRKLPTALWSRSPITTHSIPKGR